jgi:hypothetical protein
MSAARQVILNWRFLEYRFNGSGDDTAQQFHTTTGIRAHGSSLNGARPAIVSGMVYLNTGYTHVGKIDHVSPRLMHTAEQGGESDKHWRQKVNGDFAAQVVCGCGADRSIYFLM